MDEDKKLSDITRAEWICSHWMECTPGDDDRIFKRSYNRTPEEAAQAADDWDSTAAERGYGGKEDSEVPQ